MEVLFRSIVMAEKALNDYRNGDEKYSHLTAEDAAKVEKAIAEKREWHEKKSQECSRVPKTANPPVLSAQFTAERKAFDDIVKPILNKPKPKPPKQDPPKDNSKEGAKDKDNKEGEQQQQQKEPEQPVNGGDKANHMDLD